MPDQNPAAAASASAPGTPLEPVQANPSPTFSDLGLDQRLLTTLAELAFETPTPIQQATIPELLAGHDVLGLAQTGTGKTAAFGLPMLSQLADTPSQKPSGLILTPTRELALQVHDALVEFSRQLPGMHILAVYGGAPYGTQLTRLKRGVQIVVGTPGRIIDHLERGSLDLSGLHHLVLDEADEMLTMGFTEEVEYILAATPVSKQVALFSATMPKPIRALASNYLREPREISVKAATKTNATTTQRFLTVPHTRKLEALGRILEVEDSDAVIIFVRTKAATEELAAQLTAKGFQAAAINGDMPQSLRERTINQLRESAINILVATDIAARGLDVDRISHVINFDIAHDGEAYVHRIGRTGRAGRCGQAITFITPRQRRLLASIEKSTRQPMTQMAVPSIGDINATRISRFRQAISRALESDQLAGFRSLIESYLNERDDLTPTQVAAALAVLAQDGKPLLLDPDPDPAPGSGGQAGSFDSYRLAIGHAHRVKPGQIVGALSAAGRLSRDQIGRIDIREDHTLVELASGLAAEMLTELARIRIKGRGIGLTATGERSEKQDKIRRQRESFGRRAIPRGRERTPGQDPADRSGRGGRRHQGSATHRLGDKPAKPKREFRLGQPKTESPWGRHGGEGYQTGDRRESRDRRERGKDWQPGPRSGPERRSDGQKPVSRRNSRFPKKNKHGSKPGRAR